MTMAATGVPLNAAIAVGGAPVALAVALLGGALGLVLVAAPRR
jgi:hypothetical protein